MSDWIHVDFHVIGDVKFAEVKTESNGRSRGIGIVQFYNSDCARRAISIFFAIDDLILLRNFVVLAF